MGDERAGLEEGGGSIFVVASSIADTFLIALIHGKVSPDFPQPRSEEMLYQCSRASSLVFFPKLSAVPEVLIKPLTIGSSLYAKLQ